MSTHRHSIIHKCIQIQVSYPLDSHCSKLVGLIFGYGVLASENSSHSTIPKDQTSDCVENIRSAIHSIANHLTGNGL